MSYNTKALKDAIMGLYLLHGMREFEYDMTKRGVPKVSATLLLNGFIIQKYPWPIKQLAPKALELIRGET